MASINEIDEESNISSPLSISDINESLETVLQVPPADTTECSSSSSARLLLLDGTYFKYLPEESTGNKISALCLKCPRDVITKVKGYHNCTSNFLSHLKRKHGQECIEEYKTYVKRKKSEGQKNDDTIFKTKTNKFKKSNENKISQEQNKIPQEQFNENILRYFIHSMIPLSAVEDTYFSKIFTNLEISESLMSKHILARRIKKHYETQMAKIKSELKGLPYVCTTRHIWHSNKRCFIGVTAHWITNDLRRTSVALGCRPFKGAHSHDRLDDIIQEINCDFDLDRNKIVASMMDSGSNFVKAFKLFGVKLTNIDIEDELMVESQPAEAFSELDEELSNSEDYDQIYFRPDYLQCCTRTLSLSATIDTNALLSGLDMPLSQMHAAVMIKCNILWEAAGRPKTAEIIQGVLGHTLSRPNKARWNSLFYAIQQIYNIKEKSSLLHSSLNIKNAIKDNEFDYIQEYLTCTSPVAEALDILQRETNSYYGLALPCIVALRRKLLKIEKNNKFKFCKPLIKAYRQSVEKRFKKMLDVTTPEAENAAIAALSYPRFKDKWLTCYDLADRVKILIGFTTCIFQEMSENIAATMSNTKSTQENMFFNFDSDSDSEITTSEKNESSLESPMRKAELLIRQFFAEESKDLHLLDRYPEIKRIFVKYNTPLPSSVANGSHFSFPDCHKMSDTTFERRVLLKYNLNRDLL